MIEFFDLFSDLNEKSIRKALCILTVVMSTVLIVIAKSPFQFILFGITLILGVVILVLLIRKDIKETKKK